MVDTTHIDDRKLFENGPELFVEGILGKLDFTHVKVTDTADLEVLVDYLTIGFLYEHSKAFFWHFHCEWLTVGVLR